MRTLQYQFEMKAKRVFFKFLISGFLLIFPALIMIISDPDFNTTAVIGVQSIFSLMALPGIVITINALRYNGKLRLKFEKNSDEFIASTDTQEWIFNKKKITKVLWFMSSASMTPWTSYEYYVIVFSDKEQLWVSNLFIEFGELDEHLGIKEVEIRKEWIPLLKKTVANNT